MEKKHACIIQSELNAYLLRFKLKEVEGTTPEKNQLNFWSNFENILLNLYCAQNQLLCP